ncbi:amino acid ABC transporter substrate-binding protein [Jeotgalibacillus proteolyticus]|uniref:Amino acid ABC transporter substrate-binding protein n=1 Tax=Jeotgalibacillus proteolyticus TaxID=2082395 RepID=A0A2S5GCE3_9BACL|nr:amino acid ABC transporter substrate-binding protein [Jeotgalibacillus proteolyticus]PPA70618.1 amino acid ABC transporter substrate-binding protein [Jeotgalibacillus proteolyticus]
MKKWFGLTTIAVVGLLGACGGSDEASDNGNTENTDSSQTLLEQIQESGTITVGTEGTYAPFTFHDESDTLTGYDIEVMNEVAERMGVDVEYRETQWDSMFEGLNSSRFDVIANQVGIREDRLETYDFSVPYTYSGAVVVVPEDNTAVTSFEDLEGMQSAQSLTSNYADIATEYGAELIQVEGLAQAIELIKAGRAEVTVNDKLAILDFQQQQPNAGIKIAAEESNASESGFMFRQDNEELVEEFNKHLEEMKEDGTLAEISEEWFGEDVSQ